MDCCMPISFPVKVSTSTAKLFVNAIQAAKAICITAAIAINNIAGVCHDFVDWEAKGTEMFIKYSYQR